MTDDVTSLERELVRDLDGLGDRLVDEKFSAELYRALANNAWSKDGGPDGHVALSWNRAEEIVNDLRERRNEDPITLAQTGGEGEVDATVRDELDRLGWHARPLNTSRHDDRHSAQPAGSPPQRDAGQPDWEREAHDEAERSTRPL